MLACQEEAFDPESSFTRIYDGSQGSLEYDPIDVVETSTGYLILAGESREGSDFMGVKLIRTDLTGAFLYETSLQDYVGPTGDLFLIDSTAYFFAMEPTSLNAVLISTSGPGVVNPIPLAGLSFPLAASITSTGELLLLSYNPTSQESILSRIGTDGGVVQSNGYSIGPGSDIEANIYNHYTNPDRYKLPFFCGEWASDQYYFNGVYNYGLSLVFTGSLQDTPAGVVQGQGFNGGLTKVLPLQGSEFALFGFQFNDSFVSPTRTLNTGGITSSIDLMETTISEFRSGSAADIIRWQEDDVTSYTIIAAETEGRQIALYFYESATGALRGIHKVGYINPYTLASIRLDAENNLLVLGTTYVSGRFERVFLSKIPNKELLSMVR